MKYKKGDVICWIGLDGTPHLRAVERVFNKCVILSYGFHQYVDGTPVAATFYYMKDVLDTIGCVRIGEL